MASKMLILLVIIAGVWGQTNCSANESCYFSGENELCEFLNKIASENYQEAKFFNITLNSSQLHILDSQRMITLVSNSNRSLQLSIQSDDMTIPANISCHTQNSTGGIAFVRYHSIHLTNLVFDHCGAFFSNDSLLDIDSSDVYFDRNASAVLLFNHCSHIKLNDVSIVNYRGFALVSVNNLYSSSLDDILVSQTLLTTRSGSGILLLYKNSELLTSGYSPNTTITGCRFLNNTSKPNISKCQTDVYKSDHKNISQLPVYYAAGLTIIYNQLNVTAHVNVLNTTFKHNVGESYAGALLVMHLNSPSQSVTTIGAGTVFEENKILYRCHGSAILFYTYFSLEMKIQPLKKLPTNPAVLLDVTDTSFIRQDGKGAVFLSASNQVMFRAIARFKMVNFTSNTARYGLGVCMYAITLTSNHFGKLDTSYGLEIHLDRVQVSKNMQNLTISFGVPITSIFTFRYVNLVVVSGTEQQPSVFRRNFGSVIELVDTNINLLGTLVFADNHAYDGAAIMMKKGHSINLARNLSALFVNNSAQHQGGAIYAESQQRSCVFQIENFSSIVLYQNTTLKFINNSARLSGNSIYATPIYHCYMSNPDTLVGNTKLARIYNRLFYFKSSGSSTNHNLSTTPDRLVSHKTHCSRHRPIYTYPGNTLRIKIAALNEINQTCFSQVHTTLSKWNGPERPVTDIDLWILSHGQEVQVIKEDQNWTALNLTIRTRNDSCVPHKKNKHPCQGLFTVSLPKKPGAFSCRVLLKSCPPWFKLKVYSGRCECSDLLKKFDSNSFCNIQKKTLETRSLNNLWLGKINTTNRLGKKNTVLAIALNCPLSMCKTSIFGRKRDLKVSVKTGEVNGLCLNNRTGVLCSQCKPGQSVVAGSDQCMTCNNWYLFTIIFYLVSGVLLIGTLYCLRLTLASGTLNGLIFFANTSFSELLVFFLVKSGNPTLDQYSLLSSWLVRLPNLNWGYGLCLYDGMTEVIKVGLNLSYPVYLLSVVSLLALVSRYSLKVSRYLRSSTIQVLVTVVHLSFVSILLTVTDVFTPAFIYTEDDQLIVVWARNGSIAYFHHQHRPLVLICAIILLGFMLPYLAMLIIARPLKCLSCIYHQTQAILDVFHAPYKQEYKRWFVYRLLLQIVLILLYTSLHQNHIHIFGIITGLALLFFLVAQAYVKPFRSWFINVLDLWLMMNYTIVTISIVFILYKGHKIIMALLACNITVTLVFGTYLVVLIYHFLLVTGGLKKMKKCLVKLKYSYERCQLTMRGIGQASGVSMTSYHPVPQHSIADMDQDSFTPCAQLREPVLSFEGDSD